jgi:hypothetical protein
VEISDFLDIRGRRLLLLLIPALIAAGFAGAVASRRSAQYEATAVVFVSQAFPAGRDSSLAAQSVSNFITVVELPIVAEAVAEETGVDEGRVSSVKVASSSVSGAAVQVRYRDTSPDRAKEVARETSFQALELLAEQSVAAATQVQANAQERANAAASALNAYENGPNGDDTNSPQYLQLKLDLDTAQQTLATTNQDLAQAQGRFDSLRSSNAVLLRDVTKVSGLASILTSAVAAGVLAAFAAGLILTQSAKRRQSMRSRGRVPVRQPRPD